jgi:DNA-3-methyladenine glycosylase
MKNTDPLHLRKLPRSFYLRPTLHVARDLLGKVLVRRCHSGTLAGKIVETEAYLGAQDPASHAYRGTTKRNEVMFRVGGHLYVYFTYGMHYCCNVVTEEEGIGHAVLIRALEPLVGLRAMARNRGIPISGITETAATPQLCGGPARLCQALAITGKENGVDLCGSMIWIAEESRPTVRPAVAGSTRVGIKGGTEHEWRFYIKDSPFVSRGKPSGTAGTASK